MKNKRKNSLLGFTLLVSGLLLTINSAVANPLSSIESVKSASPGITCKPPQQKLCNWLKIGNGRVWICICH
jgi:hypothetical protein